MTPAEFEHPRKPEIQPEPAQAAAKSAPSFDTASLGGSALPTPLTQRIAADHLLQVLLISNVSFTEIENVLESLAPELVPITRGLFTDLKDRTPISAIDPESPSYFHSDCFHIEVRQTFSFADAGIRQKTHSIRIRDDRETDEEFPPLMLTAVPGSATEVDMAFELEDLPPGERWEWAERLSGLFNHHGVESSFEKAPEEFVHQQGYQFRTNITDRIVLHSLGPTAPPVLNTAQGKGRLITEEWIPVDMQIVGLFAAEQREIMRLLRPVDGDALIDSGLLRYIDAFCDDQGRLREERLMKIAQKIPSPLVARFSRMKALGDDDEKTEDFDIEAEEDTNDQDDHDDVGVETQGSLVMLDFPVQELMPYRLIFLSELDLTSDHPMSDPEEIDECLPSFGIQFLEPVGKDVEQLIKDRWTLITQISEILKISLDPDNLRADLSDRKERDPDGMWLANPESIHGGRMVIRFLGS